MGKKTKQKKEKYSSKEYTKLTKFVGEVLANFKKEEKVADMSSLDAKMVEMLNASGYEDVGKSLSAKVKKSPRKKKAMFGMKAPFMANLVVGLSIFIIIAGTSSLGYLWLGSGQQEDLTVDTFQGLTERTKTPNIAMFPTSLTESGFVHEESTFVVEIEGVLQTMAEDAITISPEVEAEYTTEYENGRTVITIDPDQPLDRGQKYEVTLNPGTKYGEDGEIIKELTWVIPVEPLFAVLGTTPRDDAIDVPVDTTIEFEFNHLNISEENFGDYLTITPEVEGTFQRVGTKIVFLPKKALEINTRYSATLKAGYSNEEGEEIPENVSFEFTTGQIDSGGEYYSPKISWTDYRNFISMTDEIILKTWYVSDYDELTYKVYRLDEDSLLDYVMQNLDVTEVIKNLDPIKVDTVPEEEYFRYAPGRNGLYYVTAQAGKEKIGKFVVLSDLSVVASMDNESTVGWVFNMNNAEPVDGVDVSVYKDGEIVDVVKSDSKGAINAVGGEFMLLEGGDSASLWSPTLNSKGDIWGWYGYGYYSPYGIGYSQGSSYDYSSQVVLDRPVYAAGDEVNGFGMIKESNGTDITAGTSISEVTIRVTDQYSYYDQLIGRYTETPLYEEVVEVDEEFGTFDFNYKIPKSYKNWSINVGVYHDDEYLGGAYVRVNEYTKPSYRYELNIDGPIKYLDGETVTATIQGLDYSGSPLSGERVKVRVYKAPIEEDFLVRYGFDRVSYWGSSTTYQEDTIRLDENGYAEYMFTPYGDSDESHYYEYRVEVAPADNDQSLIERVSVGVCEIGTDFEPVISDNYIEEGSDLTVGFLSRGSWDRSVVPNKSAKVTLTRTWYERVEEDPVYDPYLKRSVPRYSYNRRIEVLPSVNIKTDSSGTAEYEFTDLNEGTYSIKFEYDGVSESHKSAFTVVDSDWNDSYRYNIVDVNTSNYEVEAGETVDVVVSSTESVNGVFVVVGRDVFDSKIISLDEDTVFEDIVSTSEDYFPSFSVCFFGVVKDYPVKGWSTDCTTVSVNADIGILNVDIETDAEKYDPGDEVELALKVTDRDGKPVKTGINLKAIDQALLDSAYAYTYTSESLRDSLVTRFLSGRRSFGVNGLFAIADFGGGGGGGGDGDSREEFIETAYWNSNIRTNADGEATVKFTLPDNLTTWHLTAIAVDAKDGVGLAETDIQTNLTRFLDLNSPTYVRSNDKIEVEVMVGNFQESFDAEIGFSCIGCKTESQSETVTSGRNTREKVYFEIDPMSGYESLELTATLNDGEDMVDEIKIYVPVFSDSVIGQSVQTSILKQTDSAYEFAFNIESLDEYETYGILDISRTFALEQFKYPADISVLSTKNISNAILHNAFMIKNYDHLGLEVSKNTLKEETKELMSYLRNNQASSGGFGWFDYDAVDLEASVVAARAVKAASDIELDVNPFVGDSLSDYFMGVIESEKYSVHDKILAYDGLSLVDLETSQMYVYKMQQLYQQSEEAKNSALTIAFLMDAYNNVGNTGSNKGLVNDLVSLAIVNEDMTHWEDTNSLYRVGQNASYVTAVAYSSLTPLEEWELKYEVRSWLMRELSNSSMHSSKYHEIIYYIAVGDQDAVYFVQNAAEIEVIVNEESVASITMNEGDLHGRQSFTISSDLLKEGQNVVRLEKGGDAELYAVLSMNKRESANAPTTDQEFMAGASESVEYFDIQRSLYDFETGKRITDGSIQKDSIVKVVIDVSPSNNYKDAVVRDFLPTGFVPVSLNWNNTPQITYRKFYTLSDKNINRWGISSKDYVSFLGSEMKKGETYSYEYLAIAGAKGELSSGGTHVYLNLLPEIQSFLDAGGVTVK